MAGEMCPHGSSNTFARPAARVATSIRSRSVKAMVRQTLTEHGCASGCVLLTSCRPRIRVCALRVPVQHPCRLRSRTRIHWIRRSTAWPGVSSSTTPRCRLRPRALPCRLPCARVTRLCSSLACASRWLCPGPARVTQVQLLTRDKRLVPACVIRKDDAAGAGAALADRRVLLHQIGTEQRFDGAPAMPTSHMCARRDRD